MLTTKSDDDPVLSVSQTLFLIFVIYLSFVFFFWHARMYPKVSGLSRNEIYA
jgi:hypothetical protein